MHAVRSGPRPPRARTGHLPNQSQVSHPRSNHDHPPTMPPLPTLSVLAPHPAWCRAAGEPIWRCADYFGPREAPTVIHCAHHYATQVPVSAPC